MARGGCRLTTDNSSVDARFESSVAAVMSGLLGDDRSERPQPDGEPENAE
jgi:flagellar biosynthesis/type III secretory pathway protein FliH